ncbi:MAG: hypothetical protein ABIP97_08905, partial [Chthoniobacterales bacterium]
MWVLLYLPHLRTVPGWYGDETLIHNTARDLASGKATNFALWNTFWHPHYPYQPLYTFVCGLFARAAGGDIVGSRLFNALLALAVAVSIYLLGRRSFGILAAFFAACLFLTYEQTIIHFRMCYAHNATGLGLLLMTLFLLRPPRPANDWKAGLGLMVAAGSHPLFIHGAISAWLTRILHPRSWVRLFLPTAVYLIISLAVLYFFFGTWLIQDIVHLKNTFSSRGDHDGEGAYAVFNLLEFILQDAFHLAAFV